LLRSSYPVLVHSFAGGWHWNSDNDPGTYLPFEPARVDTGYVAIVASVKTNLYQDDYKGIELLLEPSTGKRCLYKFIDKKSIDNKKLTSVQIEELTRNLDDAITRACVEINDGQPISEFIKKKCQLLLEGVKSGEIGLGAIPEQYRNLMK